MSTLEVSVVQNTGGPSLKRKGGQLDKVAQEEKRQRKAAKKLRKRERNNARLAQMSSQQPSNIQLQGANPVDIMELIRFLPPQQSLIASQNSSGMIVPPQWTPAVNQFWNTFGQGIGPSGHFPPQVPPSLQQFAFTLGNSSPFNQDMAMFLPPMPPIPPPSYSEATSIKSSGIHGQIDQSEHIQQCVSNSDDASPDLVAEEEPTSISLKQDLLDNFISEHKAALLELTTGGLTKDEKIKKMKDMTERSKYITQLTDEIKAYFDGRPRATHEGSILQSLREVAFAHQWPQTDYPFVITLEDD